MISKHEEPHKTVNPWAREAQAAIADYQRGRQRPGYPAPGATGLCARAARVIWETVCERNYPYEHPSATAMALGLKDHGIGWATYHTAAAKGGIKPGAWIFFGGNEGLGHVVTVIDVNGDPWTNLDTVTIFENTSRKDSAGRVLGTHSGNLKDVCGIHGGSAGIMWVARL